MPGEPSHWAVGRGRLSSAQVVSELMRAVAVRSQRVIRRYADGATLVVAF